jgi:hypothetical protein
MARPDADVDKTGGLEQVTVFFEAIALFERS